MKFIELTRGFDEGKVVINLSQIAHVDQTYFEEEKEQRTMVTTIDGTIFYVMESVTTVLNYMTTVGAVVYGK